MAMGQAAGIAASVAIDKDVKVRNVDINLLQTELLQQHATLIYYKDMLPDNPHFTLVQAMGLRGYLPDWEARLNDPVDAETIKQWSLLAGRKLSVGAGETTRVKLLTEIFEMLKH